MPVRDDPAESLRRFLEALAAPSEGLHFMDPLPPATLMGAYDSIAHEVEIHHPELGEDACFYLAEQIVRRIVRDWGDLSRSSSGE